MTHVRNVARERLEAGEIAIGFGLRTTRNPEIAKIVKTAGFDWLFIDMEHSTMSVETAQAIANAGLAAGVTPLVCVAGTEQNMAVRLLTGGALGTVTPNVETAADAKAIVEAQLYPPVGRRGVSGALVHFDFQPLPLAEMSRQINAAALTVVILESKRAIENAEEIAAVPGIDVLLVGSGDLSVDLGVSGQAGHEKIRACFETVIAASKKHGKWTGCAGVHDQDVMAAYIKLGVRFVQAGTDIGFMLAAAGNRSAFLRAISLDAG